MSRHRLVVTTAASLAFVASALVPAGATVADQHAPSEGDIRSEPRTRAGLPTPETATVTREQIGEGSTLAVITHGRVEKRYAKNLARSVEVITPDGQRHVVYRVPIKENRRGWFLGDFTLVDWRPDIATALLRVSLGSRGDKAVAYNVITGETQAIKLPTMASSTGLIPDGTGILYNTYRGRIARLTWDGHKTWLTGSAGTRGITSPDGSTLVTWVDGTWWVNDLASGTARSFATRGECAPKRWLDESSLVATCYRRHGSRILRIGLDGSKAPLGIAHRLKQTEGYLRPVYGDTDVREVQGRTLYASEGGCGEDYVTRQTSAGQVRFVKISGQAEGLTLVGTHGDDVLIADVGLCGDDLQGAALIRLDPVRRDAEVLTRLRRNESWRELNPTTEVWSWRW